MAFSIFPEDPKQRLRMVRCLLSSVCHAVHTLICIFLFRLGLFRTTAVQFVFLLGLLWLGNLFFLALIRTGVNRRFSDPSLTMWQIFWATNSVMVTIFFLNELRSLLLMMYLMAMIFGAFRLTLWQFFYLGSYAVLAYGLVILILNRIHPSVVQPNREIAVVGSFALVTGAFSLIVGEVSRLRSVLRRRGRELEAALLRIEQLAVTDELTGAFNRRYIMNVLQRQKALADRGDYHFSVGYFDLDHFKQINDTLGHHVGDIALKRFVEIGFERLRTTDFFARFGGEEFLLVITNGGISDALSAAERIRIKIESLDFGDLAPELRITVSGGVTAYISQESIDDMLSRADLALYEAKNQGRNRIVCR
jgi:diguanylate cyclase (GGDEF)-like protein